MQKQEQEQMQKPEQEPRQVLMATKVVGMGAHAEGAVDFVEQYVFANKIFKYLSSRWNDKFSSELAANADEIGQYEFDESIKDSERLTVEPIFDQIKQLFNYYIGNIDGTLSPFAIINNEFIKDGVFLCILSLLCANNTKNEPKV